MLRTDLYGLILQIKESPVANVTTLIIILIILYCTVSYYLSSKLRNDKINFANVANLMILRGNNNGCNEDIPKIDEAIIRSHINLSISNPKMLTSSMVIPEPTIKEEIKKKTRMEILNMFYNSFDDDYISVSKRPQDLYIIP